MLRDWRRPTRFVAEPPCKVNGISTAKLPPKDWDAELWNQVVEGVLALMVKVVVEILAPEAGVNCTLKALRTRVVV